MGRSLSGRAGLALAGAAGTYLLVAYGVLPLVWTAVDRDRPVSAMLTRTADDIPGDPLNIGFEATRDAIIRAFHTAGWYPADPVTLRSSISIGASVLFDRSYDDAPVSSLFYEGRRQDLAFEKQVGGSASRRHHARLWEVRAAQEEERPFWLGAATFDQRVELSRDTGEITHGIAADIDAERDALVGALEATGRVSGRYEIAGIGATTDGRNGEGDLYRTDGRAVVMVLAE